MKRLLIRPGAIGDVIVSLPALEYLKAEYTEVWVPGPLVPLIQFADRVQAIVDSRIEMLTEGFARRFAGFDEVWSWYNSDREKLIEINPNCRFFKGLPAGMNASDFYLQQVGAPLGARPKINVSGVARETVVLHPYSGSIRKNWPYQHFLSLAERLPLPVEWAHDRFDDLLELGTWIAGARLFIGNDSGITHLARAVGTQTLAIFIDSDPSVWGNERRSFLKSPDLETVIRVSNELLACGRP